MKNLMIAAFALLTVMGCAEDLEAPRADLEAAQSEFEKRLQTAEDELNVLLTDLKDSQGMPLKDMLYELRRLRSVSTGHTTVTRPLLASAAEKNQKALDVFTILLEAQARPSLDVVTFAVESKSAYEKNTARSKAVLYGYAQVEERLTRLIDIGVRMVAERKEREVREALEKQRKEPMWARLSEPMWEAYKQDAIEKAMKRR